MFWSFFGVFFFFFCLNFFVCLLIQSVISPNHSSRPLSLFCTNSVITTTSIVGSVCVCVWTNKKMPREKFWSKEKKKKSTFFLSFLQISVESIPLFLFYFLSFLERSPTYIELHYMHHILWLCCRITYSKDPLSYSLLVNLFPFCWNILCILPHILIAQFTTIYLPSRLSPFVAKIMSHYHVVCVSLFFHYLFYF